jgi:hypothetical protein
VSRTRIPIPQDNVTIMSLPMETLDAIITYALYNLIGLMYTFQDAASILQMYRAILLACKSFQIIIYNAIINIDFVVRLHFCGYLRGGVRHLWAPEHTSTPGLGILFTLKWRNWQVAFLHFQLVNLTAWNALGHHPLDGSPTPNLCKFWLNPLLMLEDVEPIYYSNPEFNNQLLLVLGPFLERIKQVPKRRDVEAFETRMQAAPY